MKISKYLLFLLFLLAFSCKKDDPDNCYICTTTYTITTDVPVTGYPATTSIDVTLCDITPEQITDYEEINKGSDTQTVGGITYSDYHNTACRPE